MKIQDRFIEYAKIHSTSSELTGTHPSFEGEWDMLELLKRQLEELEVQDIYISPQCYIYGRILATPGYETAPAIGFLAHMDTSPDAKGRDVNPILHEAYDGGDITFPSGKVMKVSEYQELNRLKGETLITSDGTTLLGADDKAGIAEIMTAVSVLREKNIPHGTIYIAFTPDEEIGEGTDGFELDRFPVKYAYTVDGGDIDTLEYECFNATTARIKFHGISTHTGEAKNKMVNASNVAIEFHSMLPADQRPETTEGKEGFYHLHRIEGEVEEATLTYLVRDHDAELFKTRNIFLQEMVNRINQKYGYEVAELKIEPSYRNMYEYIKPHQHLIDNAFEAIRSVGFNPRSEAIRGGTDGARLSELGLPCPNLGTGGFFFHGNFECITVERMQKATEIILKLIDIYKDVK